MHRTESLLRLHWTRTRGLCPGPHVMRIPRPSAVLLPSSQSHTMHASPAASAASTPLKRLALHSTSTCAAQASAYGKCIVATYTDVRKDSCKAEFDKFGACLRTAVRALSSPLFLSTTARSPPHSIPSVQTKRKW